MQNLVVFIEPSEDDSNISLKAGKLYLNRFCINEESACELSGVYYLKSEEPLRITLKEKAEGEGKAILSYLTSEAQMAFLTPFSLLWLIRKPFLRRHVEIFVKTFLPKIKTMGSSFK